MPKALTSQRPKGPPVLLLLGFFLVIGLVGTYPATIQPIGRVARARGWTAARCTILSSALRAHRGDPETYDVEVRYAWKLGERTFEGHRYNLFDGYSSSDREHWQSIAGRLRPGSDVACWVDPANPADAALVRDIGAGQLAVGSIPVLFVIIPLLAMWGIFRRRRLRIDRSPPLRAPRAETAGPVALAPASTPPRRLAGAALFALLWNGFLWLFFFEPAFRRTDDFLVWPFRVVFVFMAAAGFYLAREAARALVALAAPRVSVTASARAVRLGDRLSVTWAFRGNTHAVARVSVSVVGSEIARSPERSGDGPTATRRQARCFTKLSVASAAAPAAGTGAGALILPLDTVPTFSAPNNEVAWAVLLEASFNHLPDLREEFPFVLMPAAR